MVCAGNFHGEYPAKALDYLAIAIHEIGSMSERRIERLVNPGTLRYLVMTLMSTLFTFQTIKPFHLWSISLINITSLEHTT